MNIAAKILNNILVNYSIVYEKIYIMTKFLGSKITADGDCSHEIKRHLLLGMKVMTNLDSILKCRDITLSTRSV